MAARIRKTHQDDVRKKIQASQIINRLQQHFNGTLDLTDSQIKSAKILLDKSISNAPTDINQAISGETTTRVEFVIVDK